MGNVLLVEMDFLFNSRKKEKEKVHSVLQVKSLTPFPLFTLNYLLQIEHNYFLFFIFYSKITYNLQIKFDEPLLHLNSFELYIRL